MARAVEGDLGGSGEASGPRRDAESVNEEVHDFPCAIGERVDRGIRAFFKLQFVAVEIHGRAGARGNDHGQFAGEHRGGVKCDFARGIPVAGVESGLAAAGLIFGENHFDAEVLEHFDSSFGDIVEEGIAQASAHEQNFFSGGS